MAHVIPAIPSPFGRTPFRGELLLSASQISVADYEDEGCLRKWGFIYLLGIRPVESPAAKLGKLIHEAIEQHKRMRKPLDLRTKEGQIAFAGAHLWPKDAVGIEAAFATYIGRHLFRGQMDLTSVSDIPRVTDHKSTGNKKWAKKPETLPSNIQAAIYAKAAFEQTKAPLVELNWIYYLTTGKPKAWPVNRIVHPSEIQPTLNRIERLADQLVQIHPKTDPLTLPPNLLACDKFGGCPFLPRCKPTKEERFRSIMTQSSLSDYVSQFQNGQVPGQGAAPQGAPMPAVPGQQMQPQFVPGGSAQMQPQMQPQMPGQQIPQMMPHAPGQQMQAAPQMQPQVQPPAPMQVQSLQNLQQPPDVKLPPGMHWSLMTGPTGQPMWAPIPGDPPAHQQAAMQPQIPAVTQSTAVVQPAFNPPAPQMPVVLQPQVPTVAPPVVETPKRGRGRPKKAETSVAGSAPVPEAEAAGESAVRARAIAAATTMAKGWVELITAIADLIEGAE